MGLLVHGSSLRSEFWLKSSCELKLGWSWVMGCNAGIGFRVGGSGLLVVVGCSHTYYLLVLCFFFFFLTCGGGWLWFVDVSLLG